MGDPRRDPNETVPIDPGVFPRLRKALTLGRLRRFQPLQRARRGRIAV